MKKFLLLTLSAIAMTLASCTPTLAPRQIGPEEEEWKDYISEMYPGWKQPATLPPAVTVTSEKVPYRRELNNEVPAPAVEIIEEDNNYGSFDEPIVVDPTANDNAATTEPLIEEAPMTEPEVVENDATDTEDAKTTETTEAEVEQVTEYTVVKDDSLSIISKKVYGDGNKFILIYKANKDILKDPNRLYPGMKLVIPPAK